MVMKDLSGFSPPQVKKKVRNSSIDILRAITMVLMIFVNDLWSLKAIPPWLGHVSHGVDGLGLADVVFPAFLFIVGMSLPYAVNTRIEKGDTVTGLTKHVLIRTAALLIMGVFLVNGENINAEATGISRPLWNSICCLCFILIWNTYPAATNRALILILKTTAAVVLINMAIIYRSGNDNSLHHFSPQWWGILGLIGWAYLASALITIASNNNAYIIFGGWLFFVGLSMVSQSGNLPQVLAFIPNAISGGTLVALTMGGILTSLIYERYRPTASYGKLTIVLTLFTMGLIMLSVLTRPYWGISKLSATPPWLFLCSAFTILAFIAIYWITDVYNKTSWFTIIKPAGTDTLLCYLIPYFIYALTAFADFHLPDVFLHGGIGLVKSFLFAILCVQIAGVLGRLGVRLNWVFG
jgi:heparan-alpha-glucosaminide N-acetyltransferase